MPGTVSQAFPAESSDSGMILVSLAEGLNQEAQATQAFGNARLRVLKEQSPVDWKAVAQELETRLTPLEVYLDQIEPELGSESIYVAHKWYDPFGMLPELAFFKATARGYALRAELMAIRGDRKGALRQLESIRLLAQGIRETPMLLHFLVAIACDAIGMSSATNCMTADPGGAHEYAEAASFDEQILEKDLARALRVDAFMTVQTVRGFRMGWRKFEWGIDPERGQSDALPRDIGARIALAYFLEDSVEVLKAISPDGGLDIPALRMAENNDSVAPSWVPPELITSRSTTQQLYNAFASRRTMMVLAEWIETGEIPRSLPTDPYAGAPLKAKRQDGNLVVYSVGWDGRDDGGDMRYGRDLIMSIRESSIRR